MNFTLDKLSKELETFRNEFVNKSADLSNTRTQMKENDDRIKNLELQYIELDKQKQKIIDQMNTARNELTAKAKIVQDSERIVEQLRQNIENRSQQIEGRIKAEEEAKKAKELFDNSPEGKLYQEFISQFPHLKNIDRTNCEDWGYYLTRKAQQFENEWKDYKEKEIRNFRGGILNMEISRDNYFPIFPGVHIGPHESDTWNKVNDGRNNFHRCYMWLETNKQRLSDEFSNARAEAERLKQQIEKVKAEQEKLKQEEEKKSAVFREAVIKIFLEKVGNCMTTDEADAVLGKFYEPRNSASLKVLHPSQVDMSRDTYLWKNVFKQDSLLAMKVCNRFAQQNEIRVEDAMALFKEYAAIQYILPNTNNNSGTRTYIRDVYC